MTVWYDVSTIPAEDGAKLSSLANQAATGAEFGAKQENEAFQPTFVAKSAYKRLPAIRMDADSFLQIGGDEGFDLTDMTIVAVMTPPHAGKQPADLFPQEGSEPRPQLVFQPGEQRRPQLRLV